MVNATTPAPAVRAAAPINSQNAFSKLFTERLTDVWVTLSLGPYAEITVRRRHASSGCLGAVCSPSLSDLGVPPWRCLVGSD